MNGSANKKMKDNPIFHNDNKTKKELLENIILCKTTNEDVNDIINILQNSFDINTKEIAISQLLLSHANLKESVKVIDKRDNKIYGILILCNFNIKNGSPILFENHYLAKCLSGLRQINGHSFIIDKRLRNTNIDKKMLYFNKEYIDNFDFIWCGVEKSLKSHHYWKKIGFKKLFEIKDAIYYYKFIK